MSPQEVNGRRFGATRGPVCDFCIAPNANWIYRTVPFTLPESGPHPMYVDDGQWGACDACKDDIEAGNWKRIAARLYDNMKNDIRANESIDNTSREWHDRLVAAFNEHRLGPSRWEPD